jgi:hypothetical protein
MATVIASREGAVRELLRPNANPVESFASGYATNDNACIGSQHTALERLTQKSCSSSDKVSTVRARGGEVEVRWSERQSSNIPLT